MTSELLTVPVDGFAVDSVGAIFQQPRASNGRPAVLLAHGAGASMESSFMTSIADGLVERGFAVMRFRYAYMERAAREARRLPPDRRPKLEAVQLAALNLLRERLPDQPIVLAGKSMGARMSSHLAASGEACAGLIFLGYPLHPAKSPEKLRSEHFPSIQQPSLFLQGTRDALCDLDLLERELATYGGPFELVIIEGGDHSFEVLKRSGRSNGEALEQLLEAMERWMGKL